MESDEDLVVEAHQFGEVSRGREILSKNLTLYHSLITQHVAI